MSKDKPFTANTFAHAWCIWCWLCIAAMLQSACPLYVMAAVEAVGLWLYSCWLLGTWGYDFARGEESRSA